MQNFNLELIGITEHGQLTRAMTSAEPPVPDVVSSTIKLYERAGYQPPWIGYLAFEKDTCVGACGFKSPPRDNRVEIAYFTFPQHESRGIATEMASELIRIANTNAPGVMVVAQTLPEENASTSILRKLGFYLVGEVEHSEDGIVWEWQLGDSL